MTNKIYVGNLNYETTEDDLRQIFTECGNIVSIKIITDTYTGKSRGFGFIEMESVSEAKNAIATLNGREVNGNQIRVNEAKENRNRRPRQNYRSY